MSNRRTKHKMSDALMIKKVIGELPEKDKDLDVTAKQLVEVMLPEIRSALEKGYTLEEIRIALADKGVYLAASTIQTYLRNAEKTNRKKSRTSSKSCATYPEQTQDLTSTSGGVADDD